MTMFRLSIRVLKFNTLNSISDFYALVYVLFFHLDVGCISLLLEIHVFLDTRRCCIPNLIHDLKSETLQKKDQLFGIMNWKSKHNSQRLFTKVSMTKLPI
ncbi:hypothetical protein AAHE18_19G040800 [Arachis hypogaea]